MVIELLNSINKGFNKKILRNKRRITKESIHRYEALSTATHDAIWDFDIIKNKTFYNDRLKKIFGYSESELQNNTTWWENNLHPEDQQRVISKMNDILNNKEDTILWQDEYRFKCKDGTYKIVYDRSYIVRNNKGEPLRLIGAMADITERRMIEKKLQQEQLDYKNKIGKAIIEAHESERKKLREDLHEDISQALSAVKLVMHQLVSLPQQQAQMVDESLISLNDAITKIRKISNNLLPSGFEYFGLVASLQSLADDIKNEKNIVINVEEIHFKENAIEQPVKTLIYRVVLELLNLILETTTASSILIRLENIQHLVKISVYELQTSKNGMPITIDSNQLASIQNRLEMYKGTISKIYYPSGGFKGFEISI